MRVLFVLAFGVLASFGSMGKSASACSYSYSPSVNSGIDDYGMYSSLLLSFNERDSLSVALVRTKKVGLAELDEDRSTLASKAPHILYEFEFQDIQILRGDDFPKSVVVPHLSVSERQAAQKRSTRQLDFSFWESLLVGAQKSEWYGDDTSCGFFGETVLLEYQYYLIGIIDRGNVQAGSHIILAEPVSGPEDELVLGMTAVLNNTETSPLKISPEYFFTHMDGYQIFDIKACPAGENEVDQEKVFRFGPEDYNELSTMFDVIETNNSEIFLKPQNFIFRHSCKVGDRFLVIERFVPDTKSKNRRSMDAASHRFLRITNGMVNVDDIPTNYEFTGEKIISVEQAKTWIREGLEAADNPPSNKLPPH